ncbi:MAG: 3-dehydroquinate synthase [Alistipes sp.]
MGKTIKITGDSILYTGSAAQLLPQLTADVRVIAVTDENVGKAHPDIIAPFEHILLPAGEQTKSLRTAERLYAELVEREADRSSFVLGIGGGVVTDMAGFVASTYMRGIPFGFVPTTLLGMVDAAIGGKNGIDLDGYKNMVGTFSQPRFVVCDTELLGTLPDCEFRAGLAEVVKAAVIGDKNLFELLENLSFRQLRDDAALTERIVEAAVRVKADIVARDATEQGERRKLNLGHTLAHAIERCVPQYSHGEAVAVGLHKMADIGYRIGLLDRRDAERIQSLLHRYGFSTALPADMEQLLDAMRKDKKRIDDRLHIIIPAAIGEVRDYPETLGSIRQLFE